MINPDQFFDGNGNISKIALILIVIYILNKLSINKTRKKQATNREKYESENNNYVTIQEQINCLAEIIASNILKDYAHEYEK